MHVRCPQCHHAIDIAGDVDLSSVTCPSCGSDFNLVPETEAYTPSTRSIGHFQLLEQIGSGGFGCVWKARDTELDRLVAVKIPRRDQIDPADAELFLREARAAAQLKHPHIVAVHEVGRENDTLYIVSDFVQGVTLADRLTAGPLAAREAAELCARIADALHHAHESRVIHRDLKSSNIMLDGEGMPHLMDFGLAKREAGEVTMTIEGKVLGTAAYMSPEQARGEGHRVDRRTDVYSLGVVLFELLTGELPFRGNVRMLLHQVVHDEAPSPRKLSSSVPRDLETICLKCLEKDPGKRYRTARDVGDELRRYLSGRPVQARRVGRLARGWRWAKRHPSVAALGGLLLLTLIAGTTISTWSAVSAYREAARAKAAWKPFFRNHYAAQMTLAQREWEASNIRDVLDRLGQTTPEHTGGEDLRGFEWHYWDRICHEGPRLSLDAGRRLFEAAFSHDGSRIVTQRSDHVVDVFSAADGKRLSTFNMPVDHRLAAVNHDGTRVVIGGYEKLEIYDATSGGPLLSIPEKAWIQGPAVFSDDGEWIAGALNGGKLKVWDAKTGQALLALDGHPTTNVSTLVFNRDRTRIASGGENWRERDGEIKVWDAASGQELLSLRGLDGKVLSLTFSPDGTRIVSGSADGTVKVWPITGGPELWTLRGHQASVLWVAFQPDGTRVVSADRDGVIKVWDADSGLKLFDLPGHLRDAATAALSPHGTRFISGGDEFGKLDVWDTTETKELRILKGHDSRVVSVAFNHDGKRIASVSHDQMLKVWDAINGKELFSVDGLEGSACDVAFNRDGTRILGASQGWRNGKGGSWSAGWGYKMWDAASGKELLKSRFEGKFFGPAIAVAFRREGTPLVSVDDAESVRVWNAGAGEELFTIRGRESKTQFLAFNDGGTRLVGGIRSEKLTVWDTAGGRKLLSIEPQSKNFFNCLAFDRDGTRIVSGGFDRMLKVWDAATGRELLTLKRHQGPVQCVAFNHDGTRIVSGSTDGMLKVWDAVNGRDLLTLRGHRGAVIDVAFNHDGTRIVSGGGDGAVIVWDGVPR